MDRLAIAYAKDEDELIRMQRSASSDQVYDDVQCLACGHWTPQRYDNCYFCDTSLTASFLDGGKLWTRCPACLQDIEFKTPQCPDCNVQITKEYWQDWRERWREIPPFVYGVFPLEGQNFGSDNADCYFEHDDLIIPQREGLNLCCGEPDGICDCPLPINERDLDTLADFFPDLYVDFSESHPVTCHTCYLQWTAECPKLVEVAREEREHMLSSLPWDWEAVQITVCDKYSNTLSEMEEMLKSN